MSDRRISAIEADHDESRAKLSLDQALAGVVDLGSRLRRADIGIRYSARLIAALL
jgi:hypothetical protein